jgi:hypothetical protein
MWFLGLDTRYVKEMQLQNKIISDLRFSFWMHNARGYDHCDQDTFWKQVDGKGGESLFCRENLSQEAFLFLKRFWDDTGSSPDLLESKHPAFVRNTYIFE